MESKCFCCYAFFITIYITGVTSMSLIPSANPLAVGENVTITLNPQMNISVGSWLLGGNILVSLYPGGYEINESYAGRISLANTSTSQISLYSVQVSDSGLFVLQAFKPPVNVQLQLSVQEKITNVSLTVSNTNLVEFNNSVTFTCTASGTPLVYTWYNGSSEVTAANAQLINNGGGFVINNVTRYDTGPFHCSVANNISNGVSRSIYLNVSYGPSNLTMTVQPNRVQYISGSNITLSCSCDSVPPALIQWSYGGISLNSISPTLQLTNISQNQTGDYVCIAHNSVTLRYDTVARTLNITDPLSAVPIVTLGEPPIFNNSFALTCDIMGPADSVYWIKDGADLFPDSTHSLSKQNKTLTFNRLSLSDNGKYQCAASNSVSNVTSIAYILIVNYGPWSPAISGPAIAEVGSNVTLNCSASSQPASQYRWFFQGSQVAEGAVYQAYSLSLNSSGEYVCLAQNNITGGNSSATWNLTVIVGISSVVVTPSTLIPVASKDMQLFCNVTGIFNRIQWLKDRQPLNATTTISMNDTIVDFQSLQITDDGSYQCVATNIFRSHYSQPYSLIVNYGPVDVTVTADSKINIVLFCNAKSQPPSVYQWLFNNSVIKEDATLIVPLMTPVGNTYTCVAKNPLTNNTLSKSYVITDRSAAVPLQTNVLLTTLCALVLLMKTF